MRNIIYENVIDKSKWHGGEWDNEPDKAQFADEPTGLPCLIRRNDRIGSLCGYVAIPPKHPYFGKEIHEYTDASTKLYFKRNNEFLVQYGGYDKLTEDAQKELSNILEPNPNYEPKLFNLKCHCGITYANDQYEISPAGWEKFREHMHKCKPTTEEFPHGDAAYFWHVSGHLVDDYPAWQKYCEATAICFNLEAGDERNLWLFGFDCGHAWDFMPGMFAQMKAIGIEREPDEHSVYRNMEYVESEVRNLAAQLAAVK